MQMNFHKTKTLAIQALARAFDDASGGAPRGDDGYAVRLRDNLLAGITEDLYQDEFSKGAGQEVSGTPDSKPKMCAVYSSSALVVNTFAPWKRAPKLLSLDSQDGYETIQFEAKCPTGLRGTPPHLDLLAESGGAVVGVESKCLEYIGEHEAKFSAAYDTIDDARCQTPWFEQIGHLRKDSHQYRLLDAAQLVKHALGLMHTYPGKNLTLLYLYWEPVNAGQFDAFAHHRDEVAHFTKNVKGSSLRFVSMSYPELWAKWKGRKEPDWLSDHVKALGNRYAVEMFPDP